MRVRQSLYCPPRAIRLDERLSKTWYVVPLASCAMFEALFLTTESPYVLALLSLSVALFSALIAYDEFFNRTGYSPQLLLFSVSATLISLTAIPSYIFYWEEISTNDLILQFAPNQFRPEALALAYAYILASVVFSKIVSRIPRLTFSTISILIQLRNIREINGRHILIFQLAMILWFGLLVSQGWISMQSIYSDENDSSARTISMFIIPLIYPAALAAGIGAREGVGALAGKVVQYVLIALVCYVSFLMTRRTLLVCIFLIALPSMTQGRLFSYGARAKLAAYIAVAGTLFVMISPVFNDIRTNLAFLRSQGMDISLIDSLSLQWVSRKSAETWTSGSVLDAYRGFAVGYTAELCYSYDFGFADWGDMTWRAVYSMIPHQIFLGDRSDLLISPGISVQLKLNHMLTDTGWNIFNSGLADFWLLGTILGVCVHAIYMLPLVNLELFFRFKLSRLIVFADVFASLLYYESYPTAFTSLLRFYAAIWVLDRIAVILIRERSSKTTGNK
jgi:hypothetical protein